MLGSGSTVGPRKIDKKACVHGRSLLKGSFSIEIGPSTVVHPECQIYARQGPIRIGNSNLLEEQSIIVNDSKECMVIGDHNLVSVGTRLKATSVGSRNVFECKSSVALGAKIGSGCVVGAGTSICSGDTLEDNMIVFGEKQERRIIENNRNLVRIKAALAALPKLLR